MQRIRTYFNDIFPTYAEFTTSIVDPTSAMYPTEDFTDDTLFIQNFNSIYTFISNFYTRRGVRYLKDDFISLFLTIGIESLPQLFYNQQIYLNNELTQAYQDIAKRGQSRQTTRQYQNIKDTTETSGVDGETNVGVVSQEFSPIPSKGDSLYQKTFNEIKRINTRDGFVIDTTYDYNVSADLARLANLRFRLFMEDFAGNFDSLFVMFVAF